MAHFRLRYRAESAVDHEAFAVEVSVGPDAEHLRSAGILLMHASELNGLDRLLTAGMALEHPANTYELLGPTAASAAEFDAALRTHVAAQLSRSGSL